MNIIVTGSIAYDYLMSFPGYFRDHILADKLDSISLSFLVDSMIRSAGRNRTKYRLHTCIARVTPEPGCDCRRRF